MTYDPYFHNAPTTTNETVVTGAANTMTAMTTETNNEEPMFDKTSPRYRLWKLLHDEHGLLLLESELDYFIDAANRCRWHNLKKDPNDLPDADIRIELYDDEEEHREYATWDDEHGYWRNLAGYKLGGTWTHWRHLDTPEGE